MTNPLATLNSFYTLKYIGAKYNVREPGATTNTGKVQIEFIPARDSATNQYIKAKVTYAHTPTGQTEQSLINLAIPKVGMAPVSDSTVTMFSGKNYALKVQFNFNPAVHEIITSEISIEGKAILIQLFDVQLEFFFVDSAALDELIKRESALDLLGFTSTTIPTTETRSIKKNVPVQGWRGVLQMEDPDSDGDFKIMKTVGWVASVDINVENNNERYYPIGSNEAIAITPGNIDISGTIGRAFVDSSLIRAMVNKGNLADANKLVTFRDLSNRVNMKLMIRRDTEGQQKTIMVTLKEVAFATNEISYSTQDNITEDITYLAADMIIEWEEGDDSFTGLDY